MAVRFMESFEHWTDQAGAVAKGWTVPTPTIVTGGRTGTKGANAPGNYVAPGIAVGEGGQTIVQFACYIPNAVTAWIVSFGNASATNVTVSVDIAGRISVWRGHWDDPAKVLLGMSAALQFRFGVVNYVKAKAVISTGGLFDVYVNGSSATAGTANTVRTTGQETTTLIGIGNSAAVGAWIDDVIILDGLGDNPDFVGDARIGCYRPSSTTGSTTQWSTFTVGVSHASEIDDVTPDGDATYLFSNTPGQVELWNYPTLDVVGSVIAVQLNLLAKNSDTNPRSIGPKANPETLTGPRDAYFLGTGSYVYYRKIWDRNADTGAAWTTTAVNNTEFGVITG